MEETTEKPLTRKRKWQFIAMAAVFFLFLLWLTKATITFLLASQHWVDLVNDIDHRMSANDKKFHTNSDGIRSGREATSIKNNDFNIIFLGDSFVYGFLLQTQMAPPRQLEKIARKRFNNKNINVWNFGWTSSSPILSLRLLQDLGDKYQPDLVIIALDMSDYRDDYFYRQMIAGEGIYGTAKKHPRSTYLYKQFLDKVDGSTGWHKDVFGYSGGGGYFVAREPLEENRHLFDAIYDSLNQIYQHTQNELDVPFVVFIPPRHWQYTDKESPNTWEAGGFDAMGPYALENYRYFDEKRATTPYPLISLLEDFQNTDVFPTTFDKDSHWNKHGARFAAERVFFHLLENGYFSSLQTDNDI